jgi:hypothetical protein
MCQQFFLTLPVYTFFWGEGDWDLNSGFHACKVGAVSLEPQFKSILLLFWRWGCHELSGLTLNLSS